MKLEERSFSGKLFLPRPEVHCEPQGELCIVATPWGPRASARKVIQSIIEMFHSAQSHDEVTSPFQTMTCLSSLANSLRVAVMLANDTVYREDNRSEYLSGVELFVAAQRHSECAWVQIGGPSVFISRPGLTLNNLGSTFDLALQHSSAKEWLAPLPQNLLGLASTSNFMVQSLTVQPEDKLVLIHRSLIPPHLMALPMAERSLNHFSHVLARHSTDMPFWLGLLSF